MGTHRRHFLFFGTRLPTHMPGGPFIRNSNSKRRPHVLSALNRNASVLQLHELLGYRKSQTRAAILAGNAGVGLTEAFKDGVQLFLRYTNTRIGHFHLDPCDVLLNLLSRTPNLDRSRVRKLHRVTDQVDQNLVQPDRVAEQQRIEFLVDRTSKLQFLLTCLVGKCVQQGREQVVEIERYLLKFQLTRLNSGKVEQVINDYLQIFSRVSDGAEVHLLLVRGLAMAEKRSHPRNAVHT